MIRVWYAAAALATAALGFTAGPGRAQLPPAAPSAGTVIRPQPNIDPGMKVTPSRSVHLPTPVIKPHPDQGNTVVVPK